MTLATRASCSWATEYALARWMAGGGAGSDSESDGWELEERCCWESPFTGAWGDSTVARAGVLALGPCAVECEPDSLDGPPASCAEGFALDRFFVIEKLLFGFAPCYKPLTRGSLLEPRFLHRDRTWTADISPGRTKQIPSRSRQKIRPASNRWSCLQCRSQNITTTETPAVAQRTERIFLRHLHYRPSAVRSGSLSAERRPCRHPPLPGPAAAAPAPDSER